MSPLRGGFPPRMLIKHGAPCPINHCGSRGPPQSNQSLTFKKMEVRAAEETEIDQLAKIWHEAWHDAHAQLVPAELTQRRTLESFRERLQTLLPGLRVVGPSGAPLGLCLVKDDE